MSPGYFNTFKTGDCLVFLIILVTFLPRYDMYSSSVRKDLEIFNISEANDSELLNILKTFFLISTDKVM